jgi:hypothetical protein
LSMTSPAITRSDKTTPMVFAIFLPTLDSPGLKPRFSGGGLVPRLKPWA